LRGQRMARLGHQFDTSIFGEPSYRLTARTPFVTSPTASLVALNASSYRADENRILWFPPRDFSDKGFFASMTFSFAEAPGRRSLVTVSLQARAFHGAVGHILISAPAFNQMPVQFPIGDVMSAHTFDVVFLPEAGRPTSVIMTIKEGIQLLAFQSVSFQAEPPVLDPGLSWV
jgi:hypothetical protein